MNNLRGLLGIKRMYKVPNARIRQFCGVTKGLDEKIDEGVLRWFGHVERIENNRIAKRVYVGQCICSRINAKKRNIMERTVKMEIVKSPSHRERRQNLNSETWLADAFLGKKKSGSYSKYLSPQE